uniref:Uncharacterized protein n=1 Tax=Kalanchoe fedtschenkoi TaxID=63787 RepID=A0A7N0T115_KALFE
MYQSNHATCVWRNCFRIVMFPRSRSNSEKNHPFSNQSHSRTKGGEFEDVTVLIKMMKKL